ncbi:MAG: DUF4384 domain-containing protein [bacterium]|nr:DUF4384 domain-containing protein [bacterium]
MSQPGRRPGRLALALLALVALLAGLAPAARPAAAEEVRGFDALARAIVRHAGDARPLRIGVGRFERRPEGIEDPLTLEIHHELARALDALDGVELVARAELNARQLGSRGPVGDALGPSQPSAAAAFADYLVKGTVLAAEDGYKLLVDVVQPTTGSLFKETAKIDGDASLAAIDRRIANRAASLRTMREVDDLLQSMPQDFRLGLLVGGDGRHSYHVGERIEYFLRSERDAHVAVICHQHDGASFPLLPNLLEDGSFFAAGQVAPINRGDLFDIVATTPGVDVIQAIACERRAPIDRIIESFGGKFDGEAESAFLPAVERGAIFASWRQILREPAVERCASTAIRILVSDPPEVASGAGGTDRPELPVEDWLGGRSWLLLAALCLLLRWLSG